MIELTTKQSAILASSTLRVWWLFDVVTPSGDRHYWSTQRLEAVVSDPAPNWEEGVAFEPGVHFGGSLGRDYAFRVINFDGLTLRRASAESGLAAPSETEFTIINTDSIAWEDDVVWEDGVAWGDHYGAVTLADLVGAEVLISLCVGDRDNDPVAFRRWRFRIRRAEPGYRTVRCVCEDFYTQYLTGSWPTTPNPRDLWPSDTDTAEADDYCVPVVFGSAYIPLRSAYVETRREYILGPTGITYTVDKVRSPQEWGSKSEWAATGYTFEQADRDGWRTLRPIVADANGDGTADAMGLWRSSEAFLDMPALFTRSDTAALTNPAHIIKYVLQAFGLSSADVDAESFEAAASVFTNWGLTWNGGIWKRTDRQELLSRLLAACHSTLILEEQVQLAVLSATPVAVISRGNVIRASQGAGSFRWDAVTKDVSDSGYVAWQQEDKAQDQLLRALVPTKSATDSPASGEVDFSWVQDSVHVQKLGTLHYQRALTRDADISASFMPALLALQPGDTLRFSGHDYGGTYAVVLDSLTIGKDLAVDATCSRPSCSLDDWDDLTPAAITVASDDSTNYWTTGVTGPDEA